MARKDYSSAPRHEVTENLPAMSQLSSAKRRPVPMQAATGPATSRDRLPNAGILRLPPHVSGTSHPPTPRVLTAPSSVTTTAATTMLALRPLLARRVLFPACAQPAQRTLITVARQPKSTSLLQSFRALATSLQSNALHGQVRGMKVRSSVKKLCEGCKSVRRKGGKYVYIICSKNAKHKQR